MILELELDLLDWLVREQNLRDLVSALELLPFLVEIGEQGVELVLVLAQLAVRFAAASCTSSRWSIQDTAPSSASAISTPAVMIARCPNVSFQFVIG